MKIRVAAAEPARLRSAAKQS